MRKNSFNGGKKRRRSRRKRRTRYRGGYSGAGNVILTPGTFLSENPYPPNGPVQVPPGITQVATRGGEQQYYYAKNNKVVDTPKSTNYPLQSAGKRRKSRRKYKKRKYTSKRKKRRHTRKRKRNKRTRTRKRKSYRKRRRHRGGGLSDIIEAIPGGTDLRDVYYKTGNMLGSLYSQANGYGPTNEPPMTNYTAGQPINSTQIDTSDGPMNINKYIRDGSTRAAKFTASYN